MNSVLVLLCSIVLTAWLTLAFKVIKKFDVNNLQAIVYNYISCVITGSLFNGSFPVIASRHEEWFPWAMFMGACFITLFNLVAFVAQKNGVAVASVVYKLSLVIPFLFAVFFYKEPASLLKIGGIVLALLAVLFTSWPSKQNRSASGNAPVILLILMPLLLFIGSGLLDTMIKYVEQEFMNAENQNDYLISAFASAAAIGIILLVFGYSTGKLQFSWKAVVAGISIGVPNYFSIWFMVKALKAFANNSSMVIPVNNMGIVLFNTIIAWVFFKEKLSALNWIGILLSMAAIAFIAYG